METNKIKELEDTIIKASIAYYNGNAIMSDVEFDNLLEELRLLDSDNKLLTSVGHGYSVDSVAGRKKVKHFGRTVGSLDKIKYNKDAKVKNLTDFTVDILTPKYDGASEVLYFIDGEFVLALSRGDGEYGIDHTDKFKIILKNSFNDNYKDIINNKLGKGLVVIRGEAIIKLDKFEELSNKGVANPRNAVAGILNRTLENDQDIHYITFIPYTLRYSENGSILSRSCSLNIFREMSKNELPYEVYDQNNNLDLQNLYNSWSEIYPIDGIVQSTEFFTKDGTFENDLSKFESDQIAIKFDTTIKEGIVKNIKWEVGGAGRITPLVELKEGLELDGSIVGQPTGHNIAFLKDKGIGVGSRILVTKANNVIPYIVARVEDDPRKEIQAPEVCPVCGSPVRYTGVDLFCDNTLCEPKQKEAFGRLWTLAGIPTGLGFDTIWKAFNESYNMTLEDFFKMYNKNDIMINVTFRMQEGHYRNLVTQFIKNLRDFLDKGITFEQFFYILNMRGISEMNSKKVSSIVDIKDGCITFQESKLNTLASNVLESIEINSQYIKDMYNLLLKITNISNKEISSEDKSPSKGNICITGKLSRVRKDIEKDISNAGYTNVGSVNKDTLYLVCNEPSSSSKYKSAEKLGIKIITEDELYNIL